MERLSGTVSDSAARTAECEEAAVRRDLPIGEVAMLCGYRSVYYFSQVFRDAEGISPSRWRANRLAQL